MWCTCCSILQLLSVMDCDAEYVLFFLSLCHVEMFMLYFEAVNYRKQQVGFLFVSNVMMWHGKRRYV